MLENFREFRDIVFEYGKHKGIYNTSVYKRDDLLTAYQQWMPKMVKELKTKSTEDLLDYKRLVLLAYDGHKEACDKYNSKIRNLIVIVFTIPITVLVGVLSWLTEDSGPIMIIGILVIVIAVVLLLFYLFYWRDFVPKYNDNFSKFLYYSAILSILNTMEDGSIAETTLNNTGTATNSKSHQGSNKK